MKKWIFLLFSFCFLLGCSKNSEKPKVFVSLYNLTGDQASLDLPSAKGAKLAIQKQNRKDLFFSSRNGRTNKAHIEKIMNKLSPKKEVLCFFGFSDTDMVEAAAPISEKYEKVFLTTGATSPLLPKSFPKNLFLFSFGDHMQASALAEYAFKDLGLKKGVILFEEEMEYSRLLAKYFKEAFSQGFGGQILFEKGFSIKQNNIFEELSLLKNQKEPFDFIFLAAGPEKAKKLILQIREKGFKQPLFAGDSFDILKLPPHEKIFIGDVFVSTHAYVEKNTTNEKMKIFIAEYEQKYGKTPTAFSALGYDAALFLVKAFDEVKDFDEKDFFQKAMYSVKNFEGITGTIFYPEGKKIPQKPVTLLHFSKEGKNLAKQFIPSYEPSLE